MFLKTISLSIALIFSVFCHGVTVGQNQTIVLDRFFRTMLLESEGGYVLFDKKPVCINGFYVVDQFYGENARHKETVDLRAGAEEWKKILPIHNNIIIHVKNKEDSDVKNHFHILFINKKLFLKTVQDNIILFQYILGPSVTPEGLLSKLIDPNETFHSVLKSNKVLIGIILGFGTQNSLYGSRVELLQESLQSTEHPPLKTGLLENKKMNNFFKEIILFIRPSNNPSALHLQPSFSYSSTKDEINDLISRMDVSSTQLSQNRPYFIFGKLNKDKETVSLINDLEKTQQEITSLLSSKNFLKDVLQMIFPDEKIEINLNSSGNTNNVFTEADLKLLPSIVAMNILDSTQSEDDDFLQGLISGMKDADAKLNRRFDDPGLYRKLKVLKSAQDNIKQADLFFLKLEQDKNLKCITPKKLYYQCLEEGLGEGLNNPTKVTIHCKIETPNSLPIIDTWKKNQPLEINLNNAISGFVLGMQGMKRGEIRELFIHPSMGYGIYTLLDKGIYLKARVELISFHQDSEAPLPVSIPSFDFDDDLKILKNNDLAEASKIEGYIRGYAIWTHYKKANLYSLEEILQIIDSDKFDEHIITYELQESQDLLNRLHRYIYHNLQ